MDPLLLNQYLFNDSFIGRNTTTTDSFMTDSQFQLSLIDYDSSVSDDDDDDRWKNVQIMPPKVFIPYLSFESSIKKATPAPALPQPQLRLPSEKNNRDDENRWQNIAIVKKPLMLIPNLSYAKPTENHFALKQQQLPPRNQTFKPTIKNAPCVYQPQQHPPRNQEEFKSAIKNTPGLYQPQHPKFKTERCRRIETIGKCIYGKKCNFLHPSELRWYTINQNFNRNNC